MGSFPGLFAFIAGIVMAVYYLITRQKNVDWKGHLSYTFCLIWYPFYIAIEYIKRIWKKN